MNVCYYFDFQKILFFDISVFKYLIINPSKGFILLKSLLQQADKVRKMFVYRSSKIYEFQLKISSTVRLKGSFALCFRLKKSINSKTTLSLLR
jgi:hypothetical protein